MTAAKNQNPFLKKLTSIIEANIASESFGVSELAGELNMSRSNLHRKVRTMAKVSVSQFIRNVRLEKAMEMLKAKEGNVSEVAYRVGFNSVTYFSKCFHDAFGTTPGDILNQEFVEEEINEEPAGENKPQKPVYQKYTIYFLSFLSVIAVVVIIMLIQAGGENRQVVRDVEDDIVNTIVIPEFKDETSETNFTTLKLVRQLLNDKLGKVHDIAVVGMEITEHESIKNMNVLQIADSLDADYILSGKRMESGEEKYYYFELIDSKTGKTIRPYNYPENNIEPGLFATDLAYYVANNLDIELSSKEKEQMDDVNPIHPKANELREQGITLFEHSQYNTDNAKTALYLFRRALMIDSVIPDVYARLGIIYKERLPQGERDIVKAKQYFIKAIQADSTMRWGWFLLGQCFEEEGNQTAADSCYSKGELFAARNKYYYLSKAYEYSELGQYYESIRDALLAFKLNSGSGELNPAHILYRTWDQLAWMGFPEVAKKYLSEWFQHSPPDSIQFWDLMYTTYRVGGDFEKAIGYSSKLLKKDPTNTLNLAKLVTVLLLNGNIEKANYYVQMIDSICNARGQSFHTSRLFGGCAFTLWEVGEKEKALPIIHAEMERCLSEIQQNNFFAQKYMAHSNLAFVYAYLGDNKKALQYLNQVKNSGRNLAYLKHVTEIPVFEKISKEDREIRKVIHEIDKEYEKERRKIRTLLENYDLL